MENRETQSHGLEFFVVTMGSLNKRQYFVLDRVEVRFIIADERYDCPITGVIQDRGGVELVDEEKISLLGERSIFFGAAHALPCGVVGILLTLGIQTDSAC